MKRATRPNLPTPGLIEALLVLLDVQLGRRFPLLRGRASFQIIPLPTPAEP